MLFNTHSQPTFKTVSHLKKAQFKTAPSQAKSCQISNRDDTGRLEDALSGSINIASSHFN